MRVGVIGAGVSGLAVAWELLREANVGGAPAVAILEAASRAGGKVRTEHTDGYRIEWGPEGFLDSAPRTLALAAELGLADRVVAASPVGSSRFLFAQGRLEPIPTSPAAFLLSPLLSRRGRLRVLCEPFCPRGRGDDESVASFASRRIGPEAADTLVGAMVSGIHAGDARALSVSAAFPRLVALERQHGSLTRGLLATRRAGRASPGPAGPAGRLTSFRHGMGELVDTMARALGDRLELGVRATAVSRERDRWLVATDAGSREFDRLLLAVEPWHAAALLADVDAALATALAAIGSAPVAVAALGFAACDLPRPPEGFGFLVARPSAVRIMGCLWSSSLFPGRAPQGHVLLKVLLGGATDPGAVELDDARLLDVARRDLERTMGITAAPGFARIVRHPRAIPQYTLGHGARLAAIERRLAGLPGLVLHGNGYRGVGVNDCIGRAPTVARALAAATR